MGSSGTGAVDMGAGRSYPGPLEKHQVMSQPQKSEREHQHMLLVAFMQQVVCGRVWGGGRVAGPCFQRTCSLEEAEYEHNGV